VSDFQVNNPFATNSQFNTQLSQKSSAYRQAVFKGQQALHNPYAASVLSRDSDEEAGFAMSERIEKQLAKRKIFDDRQKQAKVESKEGAHMSFEQAPGKNSPVALKDLLDELKNLRKPTSQDILKEVGQRFSDVSDQYVALGEAQKQLREQGDHLLADLVQQAQDELMEASGPAIRAGLNILEPALESAEKGLGDVNDLRDFYRDHILTHEGILNTYRALRAEYGHGNIRDGLDFLLKATACDMEAEGPSIDRAHLKTVLDNFYEVGVINNISIQLTDLLNRMRKNGEDGASTDVEALMDRIFELVEALKVEFGVVVQMPALLNIQDLPGQIYFLTGLYEQLRLLPLKIYPSKDHRTRLLAAAQQALDYVIEEEEQQEDESEAQ